MRRKLAAILAPALLLGCNVVYSEHPWFTSANAAGAPRLRDGLWVVMDTPDCRLDESQPPEKWPECAEAMVVEGDRLLSLNWTSDPVTGARKRDGADVAETVLAAGNPRVLQFHALGKEGEEGGTKADKMWFYLGIRMTSRDTSGRITGFNRWVVNCGPTPPEGDATGATRHPFHGIAVDGKDCTATSVSALRNAAARSERLPGKSGRPDIVPARWVGEWRS
jgi:hypothetical protein